MIHQTTEDKVTWLTGISYSDFPQPWPASISIAVRPTGIGVEPHGVVGVVPLLNGDAIQIRPKIDRVSFFRLLAVAGGHQQELEREFEEFVPYTIDEESNVDSLIARQLYISARDILRLSPQFGRSIRRRHATFAKGRINARETAYNLATRRRDPVVSSSRDRTYDIPENRVLTEALVRALPLLSSTDRESLQFIYHKWLSRFTRPVNLQADLESVAHRFARMQYGGPRDYYRKPLMLAEVILGASGIGIGQLSMIEGDAVLLNTATVFERYLRNIIARTHSAIGYGVAAGTSHTASLYTDGSRRIIPDIVVSRDERVTLIADAKYKEPTSTDHYQMYAYLHVTGASVGLLLTPALHGERVTRRKFTSPDHKTVWEIGLPLANIPTTEAFLACLAQDFGA